MWGSFAVQMLVPSVAGYRTIRRRESPGFSKTRCGRRSEIPTVARSDWHEPVELFGRSASCHIETPNHGKDSGNYFVYAPGTVFDIRLKKRLTARVDYEYQLWPSFAGGG